MGKTKDSTKKTKNYLWDAYQGLNSNAQSEFKKKLKDNQISPRRFIEGDSFKGIDDIPPRFARVYATLLGLPSEKIIMDAFGKEFFTKAQVNMILPIAQAVNNYQATL